MSAGPDPEQWEHDDLDDVGLDIDVLRRRRERVLALLAVAVIIGAALFVSRALLRKNPVDRGELIAAVKQAIRDASPQGVALEFGAPSEFVIERQAEDQYEVSGEVIMITPEARATRYYFRCTLTRQEQGPWRPARLTATPG